MARFFPIITVIATAALVTCQLLSLSALAPWAKMIASTGFVAFAIAVGAHRWHYGRVLLAGLFLSWWGDYFLIDSTDTRFLFGLVSFLLAHVLYCVAFSVRGVSARWAGAAAPVLVVTTGAILWWLSPHVSDDMIWPVRAYTAVISIMVVLAVGARGAGGPWSIPVGAILFYLSDVSVASGQFIKPDFPNYVWGLPAYFVGQLFLAQSAAKQAPTQSSGRE